MINFKSVMACAALAAGAMVAATASAAVLIPDNGGGTIDFPPPGGTYTVCPGFPQFQMINGFPAGSQINIDPALHTWTSVVETPGGVYGAQTQSFSFVLDFAMQGTGVYSGYSRNVSFTSMLGTTDIGFRTPFAPVQNFPSDLRRMQGQLPFGDPDFDLLRITAGGDFGLPSPGQTMLTAAGPAWSVDSFFDITYRIDFIGSPVGPFGGMSGSTTLTTRIWLAPSPGAMGVFVMAGVCAARRRRERECEID